MNIIPITTAITNILMIVGLLFMASVVIDANRVSLNRFDSLERQVNQQNALTTQRIADLSVSQIRTEMAHQALLRRIDRIEEKLRVFD